MTHYCFVLDCEGKKLAPTTTKKGWYLIRKKRAVLFNKYPMVIQLNKSVTDIDYNVRLGIDDGSTHVGVALVQECLKINKSIFKGVIEQRKDVSKLIEQRKFYRRYRRSHKRYRKARFLNRSSSKRKGRLAPSILQKKQTISRFLYKISRWINISSIYLEDVAIDIRKLTDGQRMYKWKYQQSNRLDENIRKAVILRDKCRCMECGKKNCMLEVHHIVPRRLKGSNTLGNLISLCSECHQKTKGIEEETIEYYQKMIDGRNLRLDYAQHAMQGKKWLHQQLQNCAPLFLTTGGDTANKRIDWGIQKSHSNDALVITDVKINNTDTKEWFIKPIRKKKKAKHSETYGFKHRDFASYTDTKGVTHIGYVTGMYPDKLQINIQTQNKHLKRVNAKKCRMIWSFNGFYFL
jgi:RRXRR protein/HNH endonuclease